MKTIIMLVGKGESTSILYNSIKGEFEIEKVILEESVPMSQFIKKRIKKLGFIRVGGQVLFQAIVIPLLRNKKRICSIMTEYNLFDDPIPTDKIKEVHSVNSQDAIDLIQKYKPEIVVVSGTRIISKKVLNSYPATFINIHAGITPMYRGVHGAYWALVENDLDHCGVTVHVVDAGIDTGNILEQGSITVTKADNFTTYPLLQLATGITLLKKVLLEGIEIKNPPIGQSQLRTHPTIWGYFWNRMKNKVR